MPADIYGFAYGGLGGVYNIVYSPADVEEYSSIGSANLTFAALRCRAYATRTLPPEPPIPPPLPPRECDEDYACSRQDPCEWAFGSMRVFPTIAFGSQIEWAMHPQFSDARPWIFQLQAGRTGLDHADDWTDVGLPAEDAFYLLDDRQRVYGKTLWTHYRVKLTTADGERYSRPIPAEGDLTPADRRKWLAIFRTWEKLLRLETGNEGYLLKRRLFGEVCPANCRDHLTNEIVDPKCPQCFGTGFLHGYYEPLPCVYVELSQRKSRSHLDEGQSRGTVNDALRIKGTLLGVPQVFSYDAWVDKRTDRRWFIHEVENRVEIRGVAAVVDVGLRLAPFTDPIYQVEIPGHAPV